jgi:hypothetical protein
MLSGCGDVDGRRLSVRRSFDSGGQFDTCGTISTGGYTRTESRGHQRRPLLDDRAEACAPDSRGA